MTEDMTTPTNVVVAYNFTQSALPALERAVKLAARAPFHILHVVCAIEPTNPIPAVGPGPVDYRYAERAQQTLAEEMASMLRSADISDRVHFFVHARIGRPAEEILECAREVGAELILVGTKGLTGVERVVLGSVAERIVREAKCTVEVVRATTYPYVKLMNITEVEPHPHYVPPHRYSYEDRRLTVRPSEWPLY